LALSNPTRLAILAAIADRNERRVPVVLGELGFDMKVLVKEIGRLTEAGLLAKIRGQLIADLAPLVGLASAVVEATALARVIPPDSPLRRYLVRGRIESLPKRADDLDALATALCKLLPDDRVLTEAEVNDRPAIRRCCAGCSSTSIWFAAAPRPNTASSSTPSSCRTIVSGEWPIARQFRSPCSTRTLPGIEPGGLRHQGCPYGSDAEFLATAAPFVRSEDDVATFGIAVGESITYLLGHGITHVSVCERSAQADLAEPFLDPAQLPHPGFGLAADPAADRLRRHAQLTGHGLAGQALPAQRFRDPVGETASYGLGLGRPGGRPQHVELDVVGVGAAGDLDRPGRAGGVEQGVEHRVGHLAAVGLAQRRLGRALADEVADLRHRRRPRREQAGAHLNREHLDHALDFHR
jgi:hypothetical protein